MKSQNLHFHPTLFCDIISKNDILLLDFMKNKCYHIQYISYLNKKDNAI